MGKKISSIEAQNYTEQPFLLPVDEVSNTWGQIKMLVSAVPDPTITDRSMAKTGLKVKELSNSILCLSSKFQTQWFW
jgi:hypothetical protein